MRLTDMDLMIEYVFGTGDGSLSRWSSVADVDVDGDGTFDGVRLDFDGDGITDDVLWDSDGDAIADVVALDVDDDGAGDHYYRDSGRGVWDVALDPGSPGPDRPGSGRGLPAPQTPGPQTPPAERHQRVDTDGDGRVDAEMVGTADTARARRLYLDTDGDGVLDTVLVDRDGDGDADVGYDADAPEFRR
ncbi:MULTISPECIES: hypothetical protein [unclassified Gordonia (in: high G+C Gram-positive bacteria)]